MTDIVQPEQPAGITPDGGAGMPPDGIPNLPVIEGVREVTQSRFFDPEIDNEDDMRTGEDES